MSTWPPIWRQIKSREAAGQLRAFRPRSPDEVCKRAMFLVPAFYDELTAKHSAVAETARYMALQARLEIFVSDNPITSTYLKPLRPLQDGVWEVVNKKPNPSLRVFGLFATRDVFIGTHIQLRNVLGGLGHPQWKAEIRRARFEWNQLFDCGPLIGELRQVVTGAVYV